MPESDAQGTLPARHSERRALRRPAYHRAVDRRLALGFIAAVVVAACSGGGASIAPSPPLQTSAATSSSAAAAATPSPATPTPDVTHPVGIIAIGHSGLTGEGTGNQYEPRPENSWATGSTPAVKSVYLRMIDVLPETEGHVANSAEGGAPAAALMAQAKIALVAVPVPALAIIQTVDNDIQCDGANVAEVGQHLAKALAFINGASLNTKIMVVGQLGRPSVTFIKELVAAVPATKASLTWDDPCSFFDRDGKLSVSGVEKLSAVIDKYEAETARVCAAASNCVTDGGVRKAWIDKIKYFSPDYAHLNLDGQAAEAALIWPEVEELLGR